MASASSDTYDGVISFRREDTGLDFVDSLCMALEQRQIRTYWEDKTLHHGEYKSPSFLKTFERTQFALIVFSPKYADSSRCLDELTYIMKHTGKIWNHIVFVIFYDTDISYMRKQQENLGKAFAKDASKNNEKVESWRQALTDAIQTRGWEYTSNGNKSLLIKEMVNKVVNAYWEPSTSKEVGMGVRLQELMPHIQIGSGGVRMIGIWGIGGSGKTTLARNAYWKICQHFEGHCFVENIRWESSRFGLKNLQEKLLSTLLNIKVEVQSVEDGKDEIKRRFGRCNMLIVLDDVDDNEQLEALAGAHDWFGDGSRIIITTRDESLLRTHKVDKVSPVRLLSNDEASQLFKLYNRTKDVHVQDYETLSRNVVSYAGGLPLTVKALASSLCGKSTVCCLDDLDRLKEIPETMTMEQLKISYDGLKVTEKMLFLDIACFFRGVSKDKAMVLLDTCGFPLDKGVNVLMQKALLTIVDGKFDMYDLVQDMGHIIIRGTSPIKLTRVWLSEEVEDMCYGDAALYHDMIEVIRFANDSSHVPELVSKMKNLRLLFVPDYKDNEGPNFLSNKLSYIHWTKFPANPFPESFEPRQLVVLKLHKSFQEELWNCYKHIPSLKVLDLHGSNNLIRTPDFYGLPNLEVLFLSGCSSLIEIHPSIKFLERLVYLNLDGCSMLRVFPTFDKMRSLETLVLSHCPQLLKLPEIQHHMDSLKDLYLDGTGIDVLPSSIGEFCTNLSYISLTGCNNLKSIDCNFSLFKQKCLISGGPLKEVEDCLSEYCFPPKRQKLQWD